MPIKLAKTSWLSRRAYTQLSAIRQTTNLLIGAQFAILTKIFRRSSQPRESAKPQRKALTHQSHRTELWKTLPTVGKRVRMARKIVWAQEKQAEDNFRLSSRVSFSLLALTARRAVYIAQFVFCFRLETTSFASSVWVSSRISRV